MVQQKERQHEISDIPIIRILHGKKISRYLYAKHFPIDGYLPYRYDLEICRVFNKNASPLHDSMKTSGGELVCDSLSIGVEMFFFLASYKSFFCVPGEIF